MKKLTIISIILSILILSLFSGASAGFSQISPVATNNVINANTVVNTNTVNNNPVIVTVNNPVVNTAITNAINTASTIDVSGTKVDTTVKVDLNNKKENVDNKNKKTTINSNIKVIDFNRPILIDIPINVDWTEQDNTPVKPTDSGSPVIEAFNYEKPAKPTTAGGVEIKPYYPIESDVLKCTIEGKTTGFKFVWKVNDVHVSTGPSTLQNNFKDNDVVVCEVYAPTPFGDQYIGRGMVKVVNSPIRLNNYGPKEGNINLYKNESKNFSMSVQHLDSNNVKFVWYVDGQLANSFMDKSQSSYNFRNNVTGKHTVSVKAYDGSDFDKKSLITIKWNVEVIDKSPSFKLNVGPSPVLEGNNVTFSLTNLQAGTSNDPVRKIEWYFGDGKEIVGNARNLTAVHSYNKQGTYHAKVVVSDQDSSVIKNVDIVVNDAQPLGNLTTSSTNILEGQNVTFGIAGLANGSSTDLIKSIYWDFGDGKTSTGQITTSHQYINQGKYKAVLRLVDSDSEKSQAVNIYVNDTNPVINAMLVSNTPVDEGSNVTFGFLGGVNPTPGSSVDSIKKYEWDFGDKTSLITNGTTPTVNHTYIDNGTYVIYLKIWDSDSFTLTSTGVMINDVNPSGKINASATNVNSGDLITFDVAGLTNGSSTDVIKSIEWSMGNGVNFTTQPFNYSYNTNGTYNVTLKITDEDSSVLDSLLITVNDTNPSGNILFENKTYFEGDNVTFNAINLTNGSSVDSIKTISWDFGDGSNATGQTATHVYNDNGTYAVTMTLNDSNSNFVSTANIDILDVNPKGNISVSKTNVIKLEPVFFSITGLANGSSTDVVTSIIWNLTGPSNLNSAFNTSDWNIGFSDDGIYNVTLTISDEDSFISQSVLINVSDVAPAGTITSLDRVKEGDVVGFVINGLVNNSNDPINSISWDFGDGVVNDTAGSSVTHVYTDNGTYLVVLTIDDSDSSVTANKTITVDDVNPSGKITTSKLNPLEGENVTVGISGLVNGSSTDTISNIDWLLNGVIQPGFNNQDSFNTSFANKGVYNLTLVITDEDSFVSDLVIFNVGEAIPSGNINVVPGTSITEGDQLNFSISNLANGSLGDPITFVSWDFGDGTAAVLDYNATHVYAQNGSYLVVLTLRDANSVMTKNLTITVADTQPNLVTWNYPLTDFEGNQINFSSSVLQRNDNIVSIIWNFGDSITAAGENVTHSYAQNGSYNISLTITDTDSSISATGTVNIVDSVPTANFAYLPANPNASDIVTFNSTVAGYDAPLTYSWDFGDGSALDSNQNTTHNYTLDGYYLINFKVTDADGSVVNVVKNITIGNDNGKLINSYLNNIYYSDNSTLTINGLDYSFIRDSNLTRPVLIRNSDINSSTLVNVNATSSNLVIVTATDSNILRSNLRNCTILRSTVIDVISSNCNIVDSYVDPSDTTGSVITGNSTIINSNVTYSTIDNSTVSNSNVFNSQFADAIVSDANITSNVIYSGTITIDGQTYNATQNGTANVVDVINFAPTAAFTASSLSVNTGVVVNFNAGTSSDPNIPGLLGDSLTYSWNFGDGVSAAGVLASHSYAAVGSYTVRLNVTDSFGLNSSTTQTVTVSTPAVAPSGGSSGGGGGGGGGSSGKTYEIKELLAEQKFTNLKPGDELVFKYDNLWYKVKIYGFGSVMDFRFSPGDVKYYLNKTSQVNISLNDAKNLGVKYNSWDGLYGTVTLNLYDKKASAVTKTTTTAKTPISDENKAVETKPTGTESGVDVKFGEKDKEVVVAESHWYSLNISKRKLIGAGIAAGIVVVGFTFYSAIAGLFSGNTAASTSSTKKVNRKKRK